MTKFQTRYLIVCLLSASMWAAVGRESNGSSVEKLEDEVAGLNHKIKKLTIENDNLRAKLDSLGQERNSLEDHLEDERIRLEEAIELKSAKIEELAAAFGRADLAIKELKHELAPIREGSGQERLSALLDDIDEDFVEINAQIANEKPLNTYGPPEIHEQIKQRLSYIQARTPKLIERWMRDNFPSTNNTERLSLASQVIFLLATMISLVILYGIVKMAFQAVAHAGRIGFTFAFFGMATVLSGVYSMVGIPFICIGVIVIVAQSIRKRKLARPR